MKSPAISSESIIAPTTRGQTCLMAFVFYRPLWICLAAYSAMHLIAWGTPGVDWALGVTVPRFHIWDGLLFPVATTITLYVLGWSVFRASLAMRVLPSREFAAELEDSLRENPDVATLVLDVAAQQGGRLFGWQFDLVQDELALRRVAGIAARAGTSALPEAAESAVGSQ
ncbi:hypothetical protein E4T66_18200 [Sinimarinibacterium sp. CAU 1509]|uniref:hypothetical protein n=1 Tax=Sinimarinibacterium sp. CAU 1509 TaxID=2562283 RepID=UPI0010ABDB90|nr:hypothetical protein [Sinimarinibacterium sp. CAU 1509]TJY57338.1 hypothetical protein E4T66_18200 [Sinimarinibacterium sp. CAU 1509]